MDYEKKYNEALKDMRAIYPNLKGDAKLAVGHAFPELAESEDERIRKELVAFFIEVRNREGNEGYWHDLKVADILSYLEKQKEEEGYEAVPVESTLEYKLGFKAGKESEKQKEQKPVEFPLKDKVFSIMKKLNSLNFMLKLGSNEERLVNEITSEVRDLADYPINKPAEWSEEDEKILAELVDALGEKTSPNVCAWLKSLRPQPHWKPTKNQLDALNLVILDYTEDGCIATANYLQEISAEIKKL